jgi:hypothetical protein
MNIEPKIGQVWYNDSYNEYIKIYDIEDLENWKISISYKEPEGINTNLKYMENVYKNTRFIRFDILGNGKKSQHTQETFLKFHTYRKYGSNEYMIKEIIE